MFISREQEREKRAIASPTSEKAYEDRLGPTR